MRKITFATDLKFQNAINLNICCCLQIVASFLLEKNESSFFENFHQSVIKNILEFVCWLEFEFDTSKSRKIRWTPRCFSFSYIWKTEKRKWKLKNGGNFKDSTKEWTNYALPTRAMLKWFVFECHDLYDISLPQNII